MSSFVRDGIFVGSSIYGKLVLICSARTWISTRNSLGGSSWTESKWIQWPSRNKTSGSHAVPQEGSSTWTFFASFQASFSAPNFHLPREPPGGSITSWIQGQHLPSHRNILWGWEGKTRCWPRDFLDFPGKISSQVSSKHRAAPWTHFVLTVQQQRGFLLWFVGIFNYWHIKTSFKTAAGSMKSTKTWNRRCESHGPILHCLCIFPSNQHLDTCRPWTQPNPGTSQKSFLCICYILIIDLLYLFNTAAGGQVSVWELTI